MCLYKEIIKKLVKKFAILAAYVDDINLIGTSKEIDEIINYLKKN